MVYHLVLYLKQFYPFFSIFTYTIVRSFAALFTAFITSIIFGKKYIEISKKYFTSGVREYTPITHQKKSNTPTMGGIFIIANVIIATLLWCNLAKIELWICLLCLTLFGVIGLIDDLNKINKKKGISAINKFILQITCGAIIAFVLIYFLNLNTKFYFPFLKNTYLNLGWLFIPLAVFIIVGASNAVNLTDGLDGLAIGSLIPNFATFSLISFITSNYAISTYLNIPFVPFFEIVIFASALVGSSLGFLWYNAYPAQIMMGDVGSLSLGAVLGLIALFTKQEVLLIITGFIFVCETLSVIIQVSSFKYLGKRVFKMAPIHHHFELLGWPETKVTTRFGIITLILCLISLTIFLKSL